MVEGYQVGWRPSNSNAWRRTPTALWVGATTVQHKPLASTWRSRRMERKVLPLPAKPLSTKGVPSTGCLSQAAKASAASC